MYTFLIKKIKNYFNKYSVRLWDIVGLKNDPHPPRFGCVDIFKAVSKCGYQILQSVFKVFCSGRRRSLKKLMEEFTERIDGRDKTAYNLSASIGITLHSQLNIKNSRSLVTVG